MLQKKNIKQNNPNWPQMSESFIQNLNNWSL